MTMVQLCMLASVYETNLQVVKTFFTIKMIPMERLARMGGTL